MSRKKPKLPKDLGLKIGSKYQVFLETVKKGMLQEIENCENTLRLNKDLLATIEGAIIQEEKNFK